MGNCLSRPEKPKFDFKAEKVEARDVYQGINGPVHIHHHHAEKPEPKRAKQDSEPRSGEREGSSASGFTFGDHALVHIHDSSIGVAAGGSSVQQRPGSRVTPKSGGDRPENPMLGFKPDSNAQNMHQEIHTLNASNYHADEIQLSGNIWMFRNQKISERASIYLGEQRSNVGNRKIVIKLALNNEYSRNEAKILEICSKNRHTNIISFIHSDVFRFGIEEHVYIAMERCHSENLGQFVVNRRDTCPFDYKFSIVLVQQIISGVEFIHSKNIIHKDLKPDNILFSLDQTVIRIADFGISEKIQSSSARVYKNNQFGTDGYSPFESYGNGVISLKTDIFSLGALLYFLLSKGLHPFGNTPELWSYNVKKDLGMDLSGLLIPNVKTTQHLIRCMLSFKRSNRPTIQEVSSHPCWAGDEVECNFDYECEEPEFDQPQTSFTNQPSTILPDRIAQWQKFIAEHDKLYGAQQQAETSQQTIPVATDVVGSLSEDKAEASTGEGSSKSTNEQENPRSDFKIEEADTQNLHQEINALNIYDGHADQPDAKEDSEPRSGERKDELKQMDARRGQTVESQDVETEPKDLATQGESGQSSGQIGPSGSALTIGGNALVDHVNVYGSIAVGAGEKLKFDFKAEKVEARGNVYQGNGSVHNHYYGAEKPEPKRAKQDSEPRSGEHEGSHASGFTVGDHAVVHIHDSSIGVAAGRSSVQQRPGSGVTPKSGGDRPDRIQLTGSICYFPNKRISKRVFHGEQTTATGEPRHIVVKTGFWDKNILRESKILLKLGPHQNVVTYIDTGSYNQGETMFLAMELCHEQNLRQYTEARKKNEKSGKPFEQKLAIKHAKQIVAGLVHIHDYGIIHRDLKPDNILFSRDQKYLKISDFDLSEEVGTQSTSLSQAGTEGYRAPEVIKRGHISKKADIFSLGLVLYYIWSYGEHPHGSNSGSWSHHLSTNLTLDISSLKLEPSAGARNLLGWMLDFKPEKRQSIQQVEDDEVLGGSDKAPPYLPTGGNNKTISAEYPNGFTENHTHNPNLYPKSSEV